MMKLSKYKILLPTLLALAACSDDLEIKNGMPDYVPEGYIRMNISVPDPQVVKTRDNASENALNSIVIYPINSSNNVVGEPIVFSGSELSTGTNSGGETTASVTFPLNPSDLDKITNLLVVGNKTGLSGITNETTFKSTGISDALSSSTTSFVMSGKTAVASGVTTVNVDLKRVSAKISMNANNGLQLAGFDVRNASSKGNLGAPIAASTETNVKFNSEKLSFPVEAFSTDGEWAYETYVYPAQGEKNGVDKAAFIVVGILASESSAVAESEDSGISYYRINLRETEGSENLDIEANHWYQIEINGVERLGYDTADEAAKHPESDLFVDYKIHDHALNVLSMVSDGTRELGVTHDFTWNENGDNFITVRWSAENTSDEDTAPNVEIVSGSWLADPVLQTSASPEYSGGSNASTPGQSSEKIDNGKQSKYKLTAKTGIAGRTAVIRVTWMGLKREITITRDGSLDYSTKSDATLTIKNGSGAEVATIKDYWTFITCDGSSEDQSGSDVGATNTPKLFGVKEADMGEGMTRDDGLHFPVMYGETPYTYEYKINFKYDNITGITYNTNPRNADGTYPTDVIIRNNITVTDESNGTTTLKNPVIVKFNSANANYTYGKGKIRFTIHYTVDGNPQTENIDIPLYHTGFFHFDDGNNAYAYNKPTAGYYYYEVVGMESGLYWLDRNIGATSRLQYEERTGASSGASSGAGQYYQVASNGSNYSNPNFNTIESAVCPPGYRIPMKSEWDKLRNSSKFQSSQATDGTNSYLSTYYRTGTSAGNIYFPKSRYINNGSMAGDEGAGYYWSRTASQGLEKEQIGKWLKTLYISGMSNSYINGSVTTHKMSVRCIATNNEAIETKHSIDFNVKGATHVYLYSLDSNGDKSGEFSFPGKAIADPTTVTTQNSQGNSNYNHFSYSSSLEASHLFVYFTFKDSNGKVWIISRNPNTNYSHKVVPGSNGYSDDYILTAASDANFDYQSIKGWPVWVGYNYFFTWNDSFTSLSSSKIFNDNDPVRNDEPRTYRLYWPMAMGTGIYITESLNTSMEWRDCRSNYSGVDEDLGYYYIEFSTYEYDDKGTFTYQFSEKENGGCGHKHTGISISNFSKEGNKYVGYLKGDYTDETNKQVVGGSPTTPYKPTQFKKNDVINVYWKMGMKVNGNEMDHLYMWHNSWNYYKSTYGRIYESSNQSYNSTNCYLISNITYEGSDTDKIEYLFTDGNWGSGTHQTGDKSFTVNDASYDNKTKKWTLYIGSID